MLELLVTLFSMALFTIGAMIAIALPVAFIAAVTWILF